MSPALRRSGLFVLLGFGPLVAGYACGSFSGDAPAVDAVDAEAGSDATPSETGDDDGSARDAARKSCIVHGIATGALHACAVFGATKSVACWGANSSFQAGDGDGGLAPTAVLVPGLDHVAQLALGDRHSCALKEEGTVWCWGNNDLGQLGSGVASTVPTATPTKVYGISDATEIAAGSSHTCARSPDRTVKCWGDNESGERGNGTTTGSFSPTAAALSDVVDIQAGGTHSCARLGDGGIVCWGNNYLGQVGTGIDDAGPDATAPGYAHPTPEKIDAGPAVRLHAGSYGTCGEFAQKPFVRCWGNNLFGVLSPPVPAAVIGPTAVDLPFALDGGDVALGVFQTCAVDSEGTVFCWGNSGFGQAGNATPGGPPSLVTALGVVDHVVSGFAHTCVLADASVSCIGWNQFGQLGRGTSDAPVDGGNTPPHPTPMVVALPCF